jgi:hypothetical protein
MGATRVIAGTVGGALTVLALAGASIAAADAASRTAAADVPSPIATVTAKRCGAIRFSGRRTRIVVIRRTSCTTARRIARRYSRFADLEGWGCALAREDSPRYRGYKVGFSCGKGGRVGDLRQWPHAFIGAL